MLFAAAAHPEAGDGQRAARFVRPDAQAQHVGAGAHALGEVGIAHRRGAVLLPFVVHAPAEDAVAVKFPAGEGRAVEHRLLHALGRVEIEREVHLRAGPGPGDHPAGPGERVVGLRAAYPAAGPIARAARPGLKDGFFAPRRGDVLAVPDHDLPEAARKGLQSGALVRDLCLSVGGDLAAVPHRRAGIVAQAHPVSALTGVRRRGRQTPLKLRLAVERQRRFLRAGLQPDGREQFGDFVFHSRCVLPPYISATARSPRSHAPILTASRFQF